MKLLPNWRDVLQYAWSIRFIALAFVLTVTEVVLSVIQNFMLIPTFIPTGVFAALAGLATGGAFVARLVAQRSISGGNKNGE